MTTSLDIITDALEKLGVYAPGETISGADSERSLGALQNMIDQWANDSIRLFQLSPITVYVQDGTQSYTVGQGGTVQVLFRPTRIIVGPGTAQITVGTTIYPLDSVSAVEWNALYNTVQPGPQITGLPTVVFYDPQAPLGILSFYPTPSAPTGAPGIAAITGYYGLYGFGADLSTTDVAMAPGQDLALSSNLAMNLHSYFGVGNLSPDLILQAQQSKTTLTLTNRLSRAMSVREVAPRTPIAPRP